MRAIQKEDESLKYAWMGLGDVSKIETENPLIATTKYAQENPGLLELSVMTDPKYIYFAAKVLLGVKLLPMQCAILQELWNRRFPIYSATRGFGKAIPANCPVRVKEGWRPIKDIQAGDMVYGSDGKLARVSMTTYLQENLNMYRLTLRDGRTIECCEDHQWKVWSKDLNQKKKTPVWSTISTKDMVKKYYRDRINSKCPNRSMTKEYLYALPINKPLIEEEEKEYIIHPYVLGVLLGDGSISQRSISIASADEHIVSRIRELLPKGYEFVCLPGSQDIDYTIRRTSKDVEPFYRLCEKIGIHGCLSNTKFIPEEYKYGSYEQRLELLRGLNDTDGYSKKSVIEYYTISDRLASDYLDVARSLGLHCKDAMKQAWFNGKRYQDCHRITVYTKEPIFSLPRKLTYVDHNISKQGQSKYEKTFITNIEYIGKGEGYCISVDNADRTYITKDYIVTHNSYLLSIFCILKMALTPTREDGSPGVKIVVAGAAYRQSKIIFGYAKQVWESADILRSICDNSSGISIAPDSCTITVNGNTTTFIPLGTGEKIRGLRANIIICDEFASINPDIYETVLQGFAAVSSDPIANVDKTARKEYLKSIGKWSDENEIDFLEGVEGNQIILSGTADYAFQHFAKYWKKYRDTIRSQGNVQLVDENDDTATNYKNFSVIRIPYELVPKGFMDDAIVARAKATNHSANYLREYGACFPEDSSGFFKRSIIEQCVCKEQNDINLGDGVIVYDAMTAGNAGKKYIYGIDPASESDNFCIVIVEVHPNHRRIVYCWTITRSRYNELFRAKQTKEEDFYGFCARKLRSLMEVFPICTNHPEKASIGIDMQGGGYALMEHLKDRKNINKNEQLIWPIIQDKDEHQDRQPGLHIVYPVQFANYAWVSEANNGLRQDLESKQLLFPQFDSAALEISNARDYERANKYKAKYGRELLILDSLENCTMEIEELKDELCTIEMTVAGDGVKQQCRWSTPETKTHSGKKGHLRKDRYSALVIANMLARQITHSVPAAKFESYGGVVGKIVKQDDDEFCTGGPPGWKDAINNLWKTI